MTDLIEDPFKPIDPRHEATMARALRLLNVRGRAIAELRQRLLQHDDADAEIVEAVIAELTSWGYLNDAQFAHDYARSRLSYKPMGPRRLADELRRRRVPQSIVQTTVQTTFEASDQVQLLTDAVHKWLRSHPVPTERNDLKRLYDFLARRGFNPGFVRDHLDAILDPRSDDADEP